MLVSAPLAGVLKMHNETKQQVRQVMAGLVDQPHPLLGAPVLPIIC
jgi:hypothetical protein